MKIPKKMLEAIQSPAFVTKMNQALLLEAMMELGNGPHHETEIFAKLEEIYDRRLYEFRAAKNDAQRFRIAERIAEELKPHTDIVDSMTN